MPLIFAGRTVTFASEAADGAALPAAFLGIGASDGTLLQALLVESAASPNLRMSLYWGAVELGGSLFTSDGQGLTSRALQVHTYPFEVNGGVVDRIRHSFNQQVTGINSNGAGATLNISTTPMNKFTIQVDLTAGSSAYVVDVEGSLDGTDFIPLGTLSSSNDPDMLHIVNKPVNHIRYNVTTIGAGNTMTIDLLSSGR